MSGLSVRLPNSALNAIKETTTREKSVGREDLMFRGLRSEQQALNWSAWYVRHEGQTGVSMSRAIHGGGGRIVSLTVAYVI